MLTTKGVLRNHSAQVETLWSSPIDPLPRVIEGTIQPSTIELVGGVDRGIRHLGLAARAHGNSTVLLTLINENDLSPLSLWRAFHLAHALSIVFDDTLMHCLDVARGPELPGFRCEHALYQLYRIFGAEGCSAVVRDTPSVIPEPFLASLIPYAPRFTTGRFDTAVQAGAILPGESAGALREAIVSADEKRNRKRARYIAFVNQPVAPEQDVASYLIDELTFELLNLDIQQLSSGPLRVTNITGDLYTARQLLRDVRSRGEVLLLESSGGPRLRHPSVRTAKGQVFSFERACLKDGELILRGMVLVGPDYAQGEPFEGNLPTIREMLGELHQPSYLSTLGKRFRRFVASLRS